MMTVPLRQEPNQSLQIVLGEQNCTLRFISRGVNLYCDLAVDQTVIWSGFICRNLVGLKLYDCLAFRGQLYLVDMQGAEGPHWSGLGERFQLVYVEEGETL